MGLQMNFKALRSTKAAVLWLAVLVTSGCREDENRVERERQTWVAARTDGLSGGVKAAAAAVELQADDSMVIGGGITPGYASTQEGRLRAVAVVLEKPGQARLAVVACDVLMINRDLLDPVVEEIERTTGIPPAHVLISATHTHHAPTTVTVHGYERDEEFCRRVQRAILEAVQAAAAKLQDAEESRFHFRLGEESSVGMNSRLLLEDGTIFWVGSRDDAVRPTGPFDPEMPVLAFLDPDGRLEALIFNHSTHTIGSREGGRSPAFYGLAAQELEEELGGIVCFLQGASGSTHNLEVRPAEAVNRIKNAVRDALDRAEPRPADRLAGIRRPFTYRIRHFDEAAEDAAVVAYCRKRLGAGADTIIEVFRNQRQVLGPQQGQERTTWLQVLLIGDVAIVGIPAEVFTVLGQDIKRRSPFRYTYIASLANDWIGYLPDRKAFDLGGYQTWTGLHCIAEPGTGEAMVDAVLNILDELALTRLP